MCIIKFSRQQHNGIYDMTSNLKIIISVRGGNLLFLQCLDWVVLHFQRHEHDKKRPLFPDRVRRTLCTPMTYIKIIDK